MYDGWREDMHDSYYNDDDDCCSEDLEDSMEDGMKKYIVHYCETLSRSVIVEAYDISDAKDKVYRAIDRGKINLNMDDLDCDSGYIGWVEESCGEDEDCYQAV